MDKVSIQISSLTKKFVFEDFTLDVLKGVDLEAFQGEILMIVGPSGSGKTTLLSIIAGTLGFDSGEVLIYGKSLKSMNEEEKTDFRRENIGFIFQQFHLIRTLACEENIAIPLLLNGYKWEEARNKSSFMLNEVGLRGKERIKISHLSGGEQQRIAIARAIIHEPKLLICDEPTASLDAETGANVMKLIAEIAKRPDRTVIIVTHDNRILKFADRIVYMEDGIVTHKRNNPHSFKEGSNGVI